MKYKPVKIGMGQMLVESGKQLENLERARQMIEQAANQGCMFVVLPECLDIGWANPNASQLAEPIPGKCSEFLCQAAKLNKIYVVAGLTEREDYKLYNAAVLISPDGNILSRHRKINLLEIESMYSVGDRLTVTDTPFGKAGINICADNLADSLMLGHSLARMGARFILSPSAWAVDRNHDNYANPYGKVWEVPYRELAALYGITVIGVSNVGWISEGSWRGRKCIGSSMAIGPKGIFKKGRYGVAEQQLLVVEI
ncbi:carbon-nitrogen hydrolase family protein [Virgibacillus siamensis]|uniref:carbon-nitrogen hydrolase family protein n=1 Tax=Virgibacillus siamensis TaxID=480071 RepID=UPI00098459CA|nr:carbon-nitrogen hydrolase family protein [Virgibacillus siamensis]